MFVFKAAVVGAGTMGGQIAQTIAAAGIPVVLKDIDEALVQAGLDEARNVTRGQVGKLAEKGKLTSGQAEQQLEAIVGRIQGTTAYAGFGDVDFVIEAVPERMEIKQSVFAELDAATPGHAILASNTSSLSIKKIDDGVGAAGVVPVGPYYLVNLLGLDTVLHVAEHLVESYGEERFYVPKGMQKLVADGKLGAKTGGDGFYDSQGEANLPGDADPDIEELVEMLSLKTFLEACLVLEEGVATHRDIDFGMMAGAGLDPRRGLLPPFMKADSEGLDAILERMENARERYGERFTPPTILRRLVAQGRLGQKSGQGFYAYPQPDAEQPAEVIKLETREQGVAIAWL